MDVLSVVLVGRPGLAHELEAGGRSGLRVVGPVASASEAVEVWIERMAAVVVVDADAADPASTIRGIAAAAPGAKVLVAGGGCAAAMAADALAAGACGVLPLPTTAGVIAASCRLAADGGLVLPDAMLAPLMDLLRETDGTEDRFLTLTARERQVLTLIAEGWSTAEVAVSLGIGVATVQSHVKGMLGKLGVHSTMEAVRLAWREGVAPVPAIA